MRAKPLRTRNSLTQLMQMTQERYTRK